jgi:hypothetical protein
MRHFTLLAGLLLTACASGPGGPDGPRLKPGANPSAVIAAELGFARLARNEGQWTAFRETAGKNAEMFVPQRTLAQAWLKGRADPPESVRWSPQNVWSSCDGAFAVTSGPWIGPNSSGTFATVWQRQKNGSHKWVLDMSLTSEGTPAEIDTVSAKVADCKGAAIPGPSPTAEGDRRVDRSPDGSLMWISQVRADGARRFTVVAMLDGAPREVLDASTPPQPILAR